MVENRTPTEARQGESGRSMLGVMLTSTLVAAGLAVGGYFYLFASDNEEVTAPIPSTGTTTANTTTQNAAGGVGSSPAEAAPTASPAQPAGSTPPPAGQ